MVFIYHPDCKFSKKSAPDWEQFTKDFEDKHKGSNVKISAINVSLVENREIPKEGENVGTFLAAFGEIKTVPTIKLFKAGAEIKYDNDKTPRSVPNFYKFLQDQGAL